MLKVDYFDISLLVRQKTIILFLRLLLHLFNFWKFSHRLSFTFFSLDSRVVKTLTLPKGRSNNSCSTILSFKFLFLLKSMSIF
jgi:hypothetical protein